MDVKSEQMLLTIAIFKTASYIWLLAMTLQCLQIHNKQM